MQENRSDKPPEEKAKEILGPVEKKTPLFQKLINSTIFRVLISFLLFAILFGTTFFIALRSRQATEAINPEGENVPKAEVIVPEDDESTEEDPTVGEGCIVGGCSNELCLEEGQEDEIFSTCIYKAEYICYEAATCEVQEDGECGWTQSEELISCLDEYETDE